MITPDQFKRACGTLLGIVNKQSAISAQSNLGDKSAMDSLSDASGQLNDDTLRVLVMGKFSSGKSTFLNALMGQKLLPAKPTPTTAVIGEIVYSESPEAILHPKKGYAGGNKPFPIKIEELAKYIVIDHTQPSATRKRLRILSVRLLLSIRYLSASMELCLLTHQGLTILLVMTQSLKIICLLQMQYYTA